MENKNRCESTSLFYKPFFYSNWYNEINIKYKHIHANGMAKLNCLQKNKAKFICSTFKTSRIAGKSIHVSNAQNEIT